MLPLRRDPRDQVFGLLIKDNLSKLSIQKSNQRHDSMMSLSSVRMGCSMKHKGKISMIPVDNISHL